MGLGIVIVNYDTYENTFTCIDSIIKNCSLECSIVVVDNASNNDSYKQLTYNYANVESVHIVLAAENRGYSAGVNIGLHKLMKENCEFMLISNNDVIYKESSIEKMLGVYSIYNDVGIVGPKIVNPDNTIMLNIKGKLNFKNFIFSKKPLRYFDYHGSNRKLYFEDYQYDYLKQIDGMVSGACFIICRELIERIGYFDENIFLFYEEDVLVYKLEKTNLKVYIQPDAEIVHFGSQTISKHGSSFTKYHRYRSSMYMLKVYANVNKIKLTCVFIINLFGLLASINDKNSKYYIKKLCVYYRQLINIH